MCTCNFWTFDPCKENNILQTSSTFKNWRTNKEYHIHHDALNEDLLYCKYLALSEVKVSRSSFTSCTEAKESSSSVQTP